tara:strand:+ start:614 stop:778 length:165 start_codon:yes stop_codon:yes gene_type:complete
MEKHISVRNARLVLVTEVQVMVFLNGNSQVIIKKTTVKNVILKVVIKNSLMYSI